MSRADDLRIADIVEAAQELATLVAGGRPAFDREWMRQRAAERLLEIIGEAANAMSDEFKARRPDVPWRHVVNLRHLLAHHYHRVDKDLRHYVATRLIANGVDPKTVANRLGHASPTTTLSIYSHFVPEADRDAADLLGGLIDEE